MKAVQPQSQTLTEFVDWLEEQGLAICDKNNTREEYWPIMKSWEVLFAEFFGIDLNKVEAERQIMLAKMREAQS